MPAVANALGAEHSPGETPVPLRPLFSSFFLAGFEGTAAWNAQRQWFDQIVATQHDRWADDDYRRIREIGIRTVRECVRWPLVDQAGRYDFQSVLPFTAASRRHQIQVVWDLFHYGYPPDLDPFNAEFPQRFAGYCRAVAEFIRRQQDAPYFFTPVNEPSFLAWAGGEVARFPPYCRGRGPDLKIMLVRAALAGINAIRSVLPAARVVNVDPVCRIVAPSTWERPETDADDFNERAVFEAWDMIAGRTRPELGGSPAHLDIIGVNYYWTNQWEIGAEDRPLALDDPRRVPFEHLLQKIWQRYGAEIVVTETAHADDMRPSWMRLIADACEAGLANGIPLRGVCLYPILGMPEWHQPKLWTRMGLWDLVERHDTLHRVRHEPTHEAFQRAHRLEAGFSRP